MRTKAIILLLFIQPLMLCAQIIHSVSFKDIQLADSKLNKDYLELVCEGLTNNENQEGVPFLPSKLIHLSVPLGSQIEFVTIVNPIIKTIPLTKKILPFQGKTPTKEVPDKEFILPLKAIYNGDSSYPVEQIRIAHIDYFNYTNQIVSVDVSPFQYDAKNNRLMFYSSFDIQLKLKEKRTVKNNLLEFGQRRTDENQKIYNAVLSSLVDNPKNIEYQDVSDKYKSASVSNISSTIPQELSYEYVVITSNALAPSFERFVAWKKRKGINIGIVTMEYIYSHYSGDLISEIYDDAGKLRQFLFDAYSNNLMYALLGGDKNTVPIRMGSSWNNPTNIEYYVQPTDIYFADFNGDWNVDSDYFYGEPTNDNPDYAAEIFVGRLLCSTPQHVENWTEKLIRYESNPGNGNFAYLKKAFYTQADQMQGQNWANTIKTTFSMFTTNTIFEETYNGVKNHNSADLPQFPTGADVINEFNTNYGLVSFMAHGAPCNLSVASKGYNQQPPTKHRVYTSRVVHPEYNEAGALETMNNFAYPNINYSISCETMPYDNDVPGHVGHEHLGNYFTIIYKTGNVAYLGNTRNGWISSSLDLFNDFGAKINNGNYKLGIAEELSLYNTSDIDLKYAHNLLGCPEMEMWTDIPSYFNTASVTESGNNVIVYTGGVTGAKICVMSASDNGASYYQISELSLETFINVVKPYHVTITKHNYIPFLFSDNLYIQNNTFNPGTFYYYCNNIYIGTNVTNTQTQGPVIVQNNANLIIKAKKNVFISDIVVHSGATFEIK
jgi:hypothetical protein